MELRKGQINIMVHGAEKFGLALDNSELDDRNYKLTFLPYETERRYSEFQGVITFQRLFEKFKLEQDIHRYWTNHSCDKDELDKREKEALILLQNGGFIIFVLHKPFFDTIYEDMTTRSFYDTDLVKRFLNLRQLHRDDYKKRSTNITCIRDEFRKIFQLYGAVWTTFKYYGDISWRDLAKSQWNSASMIIGDNLFFIPCLLPEKSSERKEEFYRLMADAVVTCVKKLSIELPQWAEKYLLPNEQAVIDKQAELNSTLEKLDEERAVFNKFKRVFVGDGDSLVEDVIYLISEGFEWEINRDEKFREDFQVLDKNGNPVILAEVKGTKGSVKRDHINQTDTHRERAELSIDFPSILIINTNTKNSKSVIDKDQAIAAEQVVHAVKMRILVLRTLDLLNLLVLRQNGKLSSDEILQILTSEVGWLKVAKDNFSIQKN